MKINRPVRGVGEVMFEHEALFFMRKHQASLLVTVSPTEANTGSSYPLFVTISCGTTTIQLSDYETLALHEYLKNVLSQGPVKLDGTDELEKFRESGVK